MTPKILSGALMLLLVAGGVTAQTAPQAAYDTALKNLRFRSIGPATMGGRIDDFAIVESDPRIVYAGAAAGGIFKTTNAGVTWTPIFDDQSNPSIGDIALAPSNPSILYVGTGEPNNRQSSSWGDGVYKSMDAGLTWKHMGLKETRHIGRIVVHPTNPDIVYVAALGDLWGPNKERGVYRSTDGGATWAQTLTVNEDTGATDIAIDPTSPNILYAAMYQRRRTVFGFSGGGPGSGLHRSVDGGATWTKLTRGLPTSGDMGRMAFDIYRKNTNIVYALVEHSSFGGVYRSEDKGLNWTRMGDTNPRPMYFSQIRVDPNSDLKIWLGGVNLYMSEDGGKTFVQNRSQRVHSDFHALWINPANSDHLIAGTDGGVYDTFDSGRAWRHIDNIPLGQFYEVAYDFQKPYRLCGGLQDNYSWCGPSSTTQQLGAGNEDWFTVQGGDGFYNRIDPKEPNIIYSESQDGNLSRRNLKTNETKSIRPQEDNDQPPRYRFQWNSPLHISTHDNKTVYYGGNFMFKSKDRGDNWERLGGDLTTGADRNKLEIMGKAVDRNTLSRHDGVQNWPCITVIAESPLKAGVLWAGTDDGNVHVSRDDGKTWTNVVAKIPGVKKGAYVSRIETSYKEEGTAYVAFDNHRSGDFSVYIYMTKDYGATFTRITNGIPPEAGTVHVVREDPVNPNLLFAGTEFGLFISFDRGGNWRRMKNGLPTVPVFDIQIHPRDHDLIVATHGRSLYIMDNISALQGLDDQTLSVELKVLPTRPAVAFRMTNSRGFVASHSFFAPNAPNGATLDYFSKAAGPVRITVKDKAGNQIRQLNGRAEAGAINRIVWDLRYDSPVPPAGGAGGPFAAFGGGGGGGGGRGAGAAGAAGGGGRGARGGAGGGGAAAAEAGTVAQAGTAEPTTEGGAAGSQAGGGGGGGGGGFGGFGGFARGSLVDPGEYTVTITAGGKTDTRTVVVEEDPRIELSAEDRAKRRQALTSLAALAKEADDSRRKVVAMRTALTNLTESWKQAGAPPVPDGVKKVTGEVLTRVTTAAGTFDQGAGGRGAGGSAGPPLTFTPPTVVQKITRLMGAIDSYSAAPTTRQLADIEQFTAQLRSGTTEVAKLWDEVPKLNKMMLEAGIPYFKLDLTPAPPIRAGGGNVP